MQAVFEKLLRQVLDFPKISGRRPESGDRNRLAQRKPGPGASGSG
jgi:hypothetical protein